MSSVFVGNSLGLLDSSLSQLNGYGASGRSAVGSNGKLNAYVNAATGNLVLQSRDEYVAALGDDQSVVRTYNSASPFDGDNFDGWRMGVHQTLNVSLLTSMLFLPIERTAGDGNVSSFTYDTATTSWISSAGQGAADSIVQIGDQWEYREGGTGRVETYDNTGKLIALRDADGNAKTFGYTGALVTSVTDSSGQVTYLEYAGNNLSAIRVVRLNAGATSLAESTSVTRVRYNYDALNRLTRVEVDLTPNDNSVADGKVFWTEYGYEAIGARITSVTQSDGSSLTIAYQSILPGARVASITDGEGRVTSFGYNLLTLQTTVTDPLGRDSLYQYNANNRLVSITLPGVQGGSPSATVFYEYDLRGNVLRVTDQIGRATSYEYDLRDNLLSSRDADGNTFKREYDSRDLLISETVFRVKDPDGSGVQTASDGLKTRLVYDAERHLRFSISADGRVTEYRYQSTGERIREIRYADAVYVAPDSSESALESWVTLRDKTKSLVTASEFDLAGLVKTVTTYQKTDSAGSGVSDGTQSVSRSVFDTMGRLLLVIDPRASVATTGSPFVTSYVYDGLDRQIRLQDGTGRVTLTEYRDAEKSVLITSAHGLLTTSVYNRTGDQVSLTQTGPGNLALGTTRYAYDGKGRLRMTTDPTEAKTHYFYDERDRQIAVINAENEVIETNYNDANEVVSQIRYWNTSSAMLVDGGGQPAAVNYGTQVRPAGDTERDRTTSYYYDLAGRRQYSLDGDLYLTQYSYDGVSRLVSETRFATKLAGRPVGSAASLVTPPASAVEQDRKASTLYNSDGQVVARVDGEGALTAFTYDAAGRLTKQVRYGKTVIYTGTESLQALVTAATDIGKDQVEFTFYDGKSQVVGWISADSRLKTWTYDSAGNKTSETIYGGTAVYDGSQTLVQLASAASSGVAAGTPVSRTKSWQFDALNRLTQEVDWFGTITRYNFDVLSGFLTSSVRASDSAESRTTTTRFDALGRVTQQIEGKGSKALADAGADTAQQEAAWTSFRTLKQYDLAGRLIRSTDPNNRSTFYYYDRESRLRFTVNGAGEVRGYVYNDFGEVKGVTEYAQRIALSGLSGGFDSDLTPQLTSSFLTDSANRVIAKEFDQRGFEVSSTDARGFTTQTRYNAFGEQFERTSDIGGTPATVSRVDQWLYDRRGLMVQGTRDLGGIGLVASNRYDAFGRRTDLIDPRGSTWATSYDRLGRTVTTTDANGATAVTAYDAFDRVLSVTDRLGATTRYVYNDNERSLTVTTPEGVVTKTVNNRHGQQLTVTVQNISGPETTVYEYDLDGQLVLASKPATGTTNSESTRSSYDNAGLLKSIIDGRGVVTTYEYDQANRVMTRVVDAGVGTSILNLGPYLNLTTQYEYDAFGGGIRVRDARGFFTETVFDKNGQSVAVITDTAGLKLATVYEYDGRGKTLKVKEGVQVTGSAGAANAPGSWNVSGEAVRTTVYRYDNIGRRFEETVDPAGLAIKTTYSYDANDNLITKVDPNQQTWRSVYDQNNWMRFEISPDGAVKEHRYDLEGRKVKTISYATLLSESQLSQLGMQITPEALNGLVTVSTTKDQVVNSVYDADGRLSHTYNALGEVTEYSYDAAGRVVETIKFANRLNMALVGNNPTAHDLNVALHATWSNDLNTNTAGLGLSSDTASVQYDGQKLLIASRNTPGVSFPGVTGGGRSYSTADGPIGFHYEVNTGPSASRWIEVGAAGPSTRLSVYLVGNDAVAGVIDGQGQRGFGLGTIKANTVYVVEVEVQADGALLRVFEKGQQPSQGYSYLYQGAFPTAEIFLCTYTQPNGPNPPAVTTVDNIIEYRPNLEVTNAADQSTVYRYDAAGRLTEMVDAEGFSEKYGYDAAGNRTKLTNKKGFAWFYEYDAAGRMTREQSPTESLSTINSSGAPVVAPVQQTKYSKFEYDQVGNLLIRREGYLSPSLQFNEMRKTEYRYDARGLQMQTINATVVAYNDALDASANYLNRNDVGTIPEARTFYDARGQAVVSRDVGGRFTYRVYDNSGRLSYEVDAERYFTGYTYDANDNVLTVSRYGIRVIDDTNNNDPNAATLRSLEAQASASTDPTVATNREAALNAWSLIRGRLDALGASAGTQRRTVTTAYDVVNRQKTVSQPAVSYLAGLSGVRSVASPTVNYVYNAFGELITTKELIRVDIAQTINTSFGYDQAGRRVHQLDTLGYYTRTEYDAFGRKAVQTEYARTTGLNGLSAVTDFTDPGVAALLQPAALAIAPSALNALGYDRVIEYAYDRMDRELRQTYVNSRYSADNGTTVVNVDGSYVAKTTGYDALGNAVTVTDALGATTTTYYDRLGRVIGVREPTRNAAGDTSRASFRSTFAQYDIVGTSTRVEYDSLETMGAGDVRVSVTYQANYTTYTYETEYEPDGNGGYITYKIPQQASGSFTAVQMFGSQQAGTGATVNLRQGSYDIAVQSVRVEKFINGSWVLVHDVPSTGYSPRIEIGNLPSTVASIELRLRTTGSTTAFPSIVPVSTIRLGPSSFWVRSLNALTEGGYDYQVKALDSSGNTINLTTVGGSSTGLLSGTFTVSRPSNSAAYIRADGAALSASPLTTYRYDALGNTLQETKHAAPNVQMLASGGVPFTTDAAEQRTYFRVDALGRTLDTVDAAGNSEFRSYDVYGNVRKTWRTLTDIVNGASNKRQQTEIFNYDRVGQQIESITVRRNPLLAASDLLLDKSRSVFNAYGEQIARGVNVTNVDDLSTYQEFYDYDAGGRLWQTNASGVTKAYEYDLQGRMTSEVVLPGTVWGTGQAANYARLFSPGQVGSVSAANGIRTVMGYDLLGRLIEKREPGFTQAVNSATTGGAVSLGELNSASATGFTNSPRATSEPTGNGTTRFYEYSNRYTVSLAWPTLSSLGSGSVRVVIRFNYTNGTTGSQTGEFTSANALAGATLDWEDFGGTSVGTQPNPALYPPNIQSVTSVIVQKMVNGRWRYVRDSAQVGNGIGLFVPVSEGATITGARLYYRINGSTAAYSSSTTTAAASDSYRMAAPTANGTYEYYFDTSETQSDFVLTTTRYRGQFTVNNGVVSPAGSSQTETLNPVRQQTFDRWGNILSVKDPRNLTSFVTNYRYDHYNQIVEERQPSVYSWSASGGLAFNRPVKSFFYDANGRQIGNRDANNMLQRRFYDAAGQMVKEKRADGSEWTWGYNALGQLIRSADGKGSVTVRDYDKLDRLTRQETLDSLNYNNGNTRFTTYTYDESGNRTSVTNALGEINRYRYDTRGNLVAELQPLSVYNGNFRTLYQYDAYGRRTRSEYGTQTVAGTFDFQTWSYDHFGRLIGSRETAGSTGTYLYDTYSRQYYKFTSAVLQNPAGTNITTHGGAIVSEFYENGWLKSTQEIVGGVTRTNQYRYDASGNRIYERYADNSTVYQETRLRYDALGRLERTSDDSYTQSIGYDLAGNRRRLYTRYNALNTIAATPSTNDSWYQYDGQNRITRAKAIRSGAALINGTELSYDLAGNRVVEKSGTTFNLFTYNADNQLTETKVSTSTVGGNPSSQRLYDRAGRVIRYTDYFGTGNTLKATRALYYNVNGWLVMQNAYKADGTADASTKYLTGTTAEQGNLAAAPAANFYATTVGTYNPYGKASSYQIRVENGANDFTNTYSYTYLRYDNGYREYTQVANTTAPNYKSGTVTSNYDRFGNVASVTDTNGQTPSRSYVTSADGRILQQTRTYNGGTTQVQRYFFANGQQVGSTGSIEAATFDLNYTPVSDAYPGSTPGVHIVRQGETLQGISFTYFGDASLWYLIADANGLATSATPTAGQSLIIPNKVTNLRNSSDTFKPYNPASVIGDTTPALEFVPPPPPPKKKCGALLQIIVIAVVVVATIYTAGAAAGVFGATGTVATAGVAASSSTFAIGSAALSGGALVGAGSAATIAAAAIGGAVGSIAGQLAGRALGIQDGFSWGQVATGAFTTAATAGLGTLARSSSVAGMVLNRAAARGIVSSAANQGINIALGQQEKFSWSALAASAVVSQVSGGGQTGEPGNPINRFNQTFSGNVFADGLRGTAYGLLNRTVAVALEGGGKIDLESIAADAFGNALGNSVVDHFSQPKALRELSTDQQSRVRDLASRTGADISNPESLRTLISASETSSGDVFAFDELTSRTGDLLELAGANQSEIDQVLELYQQYDLLPKGTVEVMLNDELFLPTQREAAFGSAYIDDALVGAGQLYDQIGQTIGRDPLARYALIGLDVAAGPVAFAAREAISRSPAGTLLSQIEDSASNYVAQNLTDVGRSTQQAEYGGGGAVGLTASLAGGAVAGLRKAASALDGFANRSLLRSNLGITDPSYAAHHLIPIAEARNSAALRYAQTELGYDINGIDNGIALPRTPAKALETGELLHRGPHKDYSSLVRADLRALDLEFAAGRLSNDQLTARIGRIQNDYRQVINSREIQLSTKDPNFGN